MSWLLTLPCTRSEAEQLGQDWNFLDGLEPIPCLVGEEVVAFDDSQWRIAAYFESKPPPATIAALHRYLPSAASAKPILQKLEDDDWLLISQRGLKPVQAGRFIVHTPEYEGEFSGSAPGKHIRFIIPASQAFGTGGHETTSGCLAILDKMKRRGMRFGSIADIGTGTGLLAFAANRLWPHAYVTASDIDPVSIDITAHNANLNHIPLGRARGAVALCKAVGTDHPLIQRRGPYDLLIANILARPLIDLAGDFAQIITAGGSLILAGLLNDQSPGVLRAYHAHGFRLHSRRHNGDWPCLHLVKRRRYGWRRSLRSGGQNSQPPGDFGTW